MINRESILKLNEDAIFFDDFPDEAIIGLTSYGQVVYSYSVVKVYMKDYKNYDDEQAYSEIFIKAFKARYNENKNTPLILYDDKILAGFDKYFGV